MWWSIVRRGVAWYRRRGVTWLWWCWYLLSSWHQETNNLSSYCFPSLIRKLTKLPSDFFKDVRDGVWIEVIEFDEHGFFGGRLQYTIHGLLVFLKSFIWLLFKMQFLSCCLLWCFPFFVFLFYTILSHQSVLRYCRSGEVDSHNWIRVPPGGILIYQYHIPLI